MARYALHKRVGPLPMPGAVLLLAVLLAICLASPGSSAVPCRLDIGSQVPDLSGMDITGNTQSIGSLRGKWVFVDFWATWCKPCMRKLPSVVDMHDQLAGRNDFAVLSISLDYDNSLKQVRSVTDKYGIDFPVLYDGRGWQNENVMSWCVDAIPATFLIDPQGRLIARDVAPESVRNLISSNSYAETATRIELKSSERLVTSGSASGLKDRQDFQVALDFQQNSRNVDFYRLNIAYAYYDEQRQLVESRSRYDIRIHLREAPNGFPYDLEIYRQRIDPQEDVWLNFEPYIGTPTRDTANEGALMARVDLEARSYRFILPIPRNCVMIAYNLDLFDRSLNDYISNGVRRMESAY